MITKITDNERRIAAKLFAMLHNNANIYSYGPSARLGRDDAVTRYVGVVRELKQFMKELEE
jgi:hypothetical protein